MSMLADVFTWMSDAYEAVIDGGERTEEALIQLQKFLQYRAITLTAGLKVKQKEELVEQHQKAIRSYASMTKSHIQALSDQLLPSIEGQFSKSIEETLKRNASDYDKL